MSEPRIPAGKYYAMILGTKIEQFDSGSMCIDLKLAITRGDYQSKICLKRLFFQTTDLPVAKAKFNRMGGELQTFNTVESDVQTLTGSQLIISISYDDMERQRVIIYEYIGRGNTSKYR